jgi:hypothetical protein
MIGEARHSSFKSRKKRHLGHSGNSCVRLRPEHADQVWAWDFIFDRTASGRSLKWLWVVDEYTREPMAILVEMVPFPRRIRPP